MKSLTLADVAHHFLHFDGGKESGALAIKLMDCAWVQRLRDISQTANTRLVYMFSEHSRFGHSLGVAYLANILMDHLEKLNGQEVGKYRSAISAAAMLHDVGHLAPGSHTAYKTWFINGADKHEEVTVRIIREDEEIGRILRGVSSDFSDTVCKILLESPDLPPWTWQIISGGGWNADRGNWCIVDSTLAGVSYGKYNVTALIDSMIITDRMELAVKENRLDAMMHFALSRHAMYRQVYQHRVLLAADTLNTAVVKRARDLGGGFFNDDDMQAFLKAETVNELSLENIYANREAWWRYHLFKWSKSADPVLADLSSRLLNRKLFKTVRVGEEEEVSVLWDQAKTAVEEAGFDSRYYLHRVSAPDVHKGDLARSMPVQMDDGKIKPMGEAEKLFHSLVSESGDAGKDWLVMPLEAKALLGRNR